MACVLCCAAECAHSGDVRHLQQVVGGRRALAPQHDRRRRHATPRHTHSLASYETVIQYCAALYRTVSIQQASILQFRSRGVCANNVQYSYCRTVPESSGGQPDRRADRLLLELAIRVLHIWLFGNVTCAHIPTYISL